MTKIRIRIGEKVLYEGKMNTVKLKKFKPKERERVLFLRWLCKLAKVSEMTPPPKWILVIQYVLFPIRMIGLKYSPIKWDPPTNVYEIDGIKVSGHVFSFFKNASKSKEFFRLLKNERGIITVETIGSDSSFYGDITSKDFLKIMYKKMIEVDERFGGSSSFGDTLYVVWGQREKSTKEIMEYLIQNDK